MLREIRVYGQLAEFLGQQVFHAVVSSAAEAIRFLCSNFPQLEAHMSERHYRVSTGRHQIGLDELHNPSGQAIIRIAPVVGGAGGAFGRIAIGAALIAASFFTGGATIGLGASSIAVSSVVFGVGASLALGGIAQLLTPTPRLATGENSDADPRKSHSFSGVQNVSRQGVPIPVIFGEAITGSIVASEDVDVTQVQI